MNKKVKENAVVLLKEEKLAQQAAEPVREILERIERDWAGVKTIQHEDEYAALVEDLKKVKRLYDGLDAQRKELTDPLNGVLKKINGAVKPMLEALNNWELKFKQILTHYEGNKRTVLMLNAAKEARKVIKENPQYAQDILDAAKAESATPKIEGVQYRTKWTFTIEDETQIPREFLIVDEKKLAKFAEAMKDKASVAGVKFIEEKVLAVTV